MDTFIWAKGIIYPLATRTLCIQRHQPVVDVTMHILGQNSIVEDLCSYAVGYFEDAPQTPFIFGL